MAQNIREFILQLGFDGNEVLQGLNAIEKRLEEIAVKAQKLANIPPAGGGGAGGGGAGGGGGKSAPKTEQANAIRRARLLTTIELAGRRAVRGSNAAGSEEMKKAFSKITAKLETFKDAAREAGNAAGFAKITNSLRLTNDTLTQTIQKSNKLTRSFQAQKFAANAAADSARNMARSYLSVFAAVGSLGAMGKVGMNLESVQSGLLASSGSAEQAAKDFEFVSSVAKKFGTDLETSAKGYSQVAVAAKDAGMSADQTKEIFLASVEASTAFGLAAEDTSGVIRAFTQIISKGTVSSEELKQQLGDRLPIAMSTAAKAMKKTVPEFTKMLEKGEVIATDFLPKFSKQLRIAARAGGALESALKSSRVAMGRMSATLQSNVFKAFEEGVSSGLGSFFNDIRISLEQATPTFKALGRVIGAFFKVLGIGLRSVLQVFRPFGMLLDQVTETFSTLGDKTAETGRELSGFFHTLKFGVGALKTFAAFALLPFALMELGLNKVAAMEDGPMKTILTFFAALGQLVIAKSLFSMVLGRGGKKGFLSKFASLGKKSGGLFVQGFIAALAGAAIGDLITSMLTDSMKAGLASFVGAVVDSFKFSVLGDMESLRRMEGLAKFENAQLAQQAKATQRAQAPKQIIGNVNIQIDAAGMDTEQLKVALDERFQNVLTSAMEATN